MDCKMHHYFMCYSERKITANYNSKTHDSQMEKFGWGKCLGIDGVQYVRLTFLTFFFNAATVKL